MPSKQTTWLPILGGSYNIVLAQDVNHIKVCVDRVCRVLGMDSIAKIERPSGIPSRIVLKNGATLDIKPVSCGYDRFLGLRPAVIIDLTFERKKEVILAVIDHMTAMGAEYRKSLDRITV